MENIKEKTPGIKGTKCDIFSIKDQENFAIFFEDDCFKEIFGDKFINADNVNCGFNKIKPPTINFGEGYELISQEEHTLKIGVDKKIDMVISDITNKKNKILLFKHFFETSKIIDTLTVGLIQDITKEKLLEASNDDMFFDKIITSKSEEIINYLKTFLEEHLNNTGVLFQRFSKLEKKIKIVFERKTENINKKEEEIRKEYTLIRTMKEEHEYSIKQFSSQLNIIKNKNAKELGLADKNILKKYKEEISRLKDYKDMEKEIRLKQENIQKEKKIYVTYLQKLKNLIYLEISRISRMDKYI